VSARTAILWLTLNLLALAGGWWWFAERAEEKQQKTIAEIRSQLPAAAFDSRKNARPANAASGKERVVYVTNQLDWSQVESADYRKYIANLRAIRCPEQTIKDIIITDVMKLYALRRGDLQHNGREFRYWETNEKRALTKRQFAERESQLASIDKELPTVLRELLGVNYERELNKYFMDARDEERRLAFLDDAKMTQVLAVRDLIEGLREAAKDDPQKLAEIETQRGQLLAQVLTPAEREQYELAMSPTAERLRGELIGFNPTEDEFRMIYELWRGFEEKLATASPADREAERARLDADIRAKLGDRATDYARVQNREYRDLVMFSVQYELPAAMARSLQDMREAALAVRESVMSDANLAGEQREVALRALQEEIERTIRASLGEQLYGSFAQGPGQWVQSLGKPMNFSLR
jgi:hypothetical protein